jgi:hypothetical protein
MGWGFSRLSRWALSWLSRGAVSWLSCGALCGSSCGAMRRHFFADAHVSVMDKLRFGCQALIITTDIGIVGNLKSR